MMIYTASSLINDSRLGTKCASQRVDPVSAYPRLPAARPSIRLHVITETAPAASRRAVGVFINAVTRV